MTSVIVVDDDRDTVEVFCEYLAKRHSSPLVVVITSWLFFSKNSLY